MVVKASVQADGTVI